MPLAIDGVAFGKGHHQRGHIDRRVHLIGETQEPLAVVAHHQLEERPHHTHLLDQDEAPQLDRPLERGRHRLGHVSTTVGEGVGGGANRGGHLGVCLACRRCGAHRYLQHATLGAIGEHHRQRAWVALVGTGDHQQAGADVGDVTGHWAVGQHQLRREARILRRDLSRPRHHAGGGLDRTDTATGRRVAQRTADVVAETERRHAARERRAFAPAGAAGSAVRVPRVVRDAVQRALGGDAQPEVGEVGAPDRNGAGSTGPLHERRIGGRDRFGECHDGLRRGCPGDVDVLLDRHGYAVQRTQRFARGYGAVGGVGGDESLRVHAPHDCVQVRVDLVDASEMGNDHLPAGDLLAGDQAG